MIRTFKDKVFAVLSTFLSVLDPVLKPTTFTWGVGGTGSLAIFPLEVKVHSRHVWMLLHLLAVANLRFAPRIGIYVDKGGKIASHTESPWFSFLLSRAAASVVQPKITLYAPTGHDGLTGHVSNTTRV